MAPLLPLGSYPDQLSAVISENSDITEEQLELHDIPESAVLLQSLQQSRNQWLLSTFSKFSAKAKGKLPAITPPPHTVRSHGRYDLEIGPHTFPNTAIYEVHYPPPPPPVQMHPAGTQADTPLSLHPNMLITSDSVVTPELVRQVHAAAASNPILDNLINQATRGKASADQLKTLGLLIQTLGIMESQPATGGQTSGLPVQDNSPVPPLKEFDIVIEFQERTIDRRVLTRAPAVCDTKLLHSTSHYCELLLRLSIVSADGNTESARKASVVNLHWSKVPTSVRDLMLRWIGGDEKMKENGKILEDLSSEALKRKFLQYRLPDGDMYSVIQAAALPQYTTKSIKPTQQDLARQRRRAARKVVTSTQPSEQTVKRKRTSKASQSSTPLPIACHSCGQTDVPLLMGGRYCRICMDAGKGANVLHMPSSSNSQAPTSVTSSNLQVRMYAPPSTGSSVSALATADGTVSNGNEAVG